LKWYFHAVSYAFGQNIDYGVLRKIYGQTQGEIRYPPRQNLSVRMGIRRYTRLTNAFSRKMEIHAAAVALYYFSYNLVKIHGNLRTTPAMAAGVRDRLWEASDLVALLEASERGLERAA
jgi:hypothetical protein